MRKIFILILSVIAINTAFAQSFGTTAEIINSDCRIQFNNTNGTKIFELIGENLTWWKQSNNSIVIRDKVTQVTIASNYSGTPAFAVLDDSLDAWIESCKDCCSSGGGGSSAGENTFQFSDGNGGFYQINDTIVDEGDTVSVYVGLGSGMPSFEIGGNNTASGNESLAVGRGNSATGSASFAIGAFNTANAQGSTAIGVFNTANGFGSLIGGTFSEVSTDAPEDPQPTDVLFAMGNGSENDGLSNAITLNRNGNLKTTGAIANIAYYVDDTPGGFTIPDNKYLAIYDPASLQASATITMPANPVDGQIQIIAFGGTITSGTAVTSLTLATTGGQRLNVGTAASVGLIEQPLTFLYIAYLNKWYLISK